MRARGILVSLALLLPVGALAQTATFPLNAQQISGTNAAQSLVLTPNQVSQNVRVYDFLALCSGGTASLSILDGATTIRSYPNLVTQSIRPGTFLPVPLIATRGHTMTLTVSSCGVGNTSTLSVRADSY